MQLKKTAPQKKQMKTNRVSGEWDLFERVSVGHFDKSSLIGARPLDQTACFRFQRMFLTSYENCVSRVLRMRFSVCFAHALLLFLWTLISPVQNFQTESETPVSFLFSLHCAAAVRCFFGNSACCFLLSSDEVQLSCLRLCSNWLFQWSS